MADKIIENIEKIRKNLITNDRRFSEKDGKLYFDGANLEELAKKYPTPVYIFSEKEILRNLDEIKEAFVGHKNTKIFYASKACSVMAFLRVIKEAGVGIETNSFYEVKKALEIGFKGEDIVFNGVVKKEHELEYAIAHDLYLINVDSLFELDMIDRISRRLKKVANVSVRVEPNVPSATHPGLVTAFHAKSGIDLEQAEGAIRRILEMPYVNVRGLHMHVGDQVPESEPFGKATAVLVNESIRLEKLLGCKFEMINVGGGIPVPYKYDDENGDPLHDNMYAGIDSKQFADAIINEVHKWREDVVICIEPGRKVPSSAAVTLTTVACEKIKTNYDVDGNVECHVDWKLCDCGYNVMADAQHYGWFFYMWNASRINEAHDHYIKLAGPLCDGGDYYHQGVKGEEYLVPASTTVGDILVFIDTGAYSIESQTVYNNRPRTAVVMIDKDGNDRLIRREDTYADILAYDIY